jgi:hypothetical protein
MTEQMLLDSSQEVHDEPQEQKKVVFRVKNWRSFQHYKNRSPQWIKLHKSLLDDFTFQCLPLASRALAPMIWLLASEGENGEFNSDLKILAFRLRTSEEEIKKALKPLIDAGFVESDSNLLADDEQSSSALLCQRREEKRRYMSDFASDEFDQFWNVYGKKTGKENCLKWWKKNKPNAELRKTIIESARTYAANTPELQYRKNPLTWLNGRHWEDQLTTESSIDEDIFAGVK